MEHMSAARLLVIIATFARACDNGCRVGRWLGLNKETALWIAFSRFLVALLIEGLICGELGLGQH